MFTPPQTQPLSHPPVAHPGLTFEEEEAAVQASLQSNATGLRYYNPLLPSCVTHLKLFTLYNMKSIIKLLRFSAFLCHPGYGLPFLGAGTGFLSPLPLFGEISLVDEHIIMELSSKIIGTREES